MRPSETAAADAHTLDHYRLGGRIPLSAVTPTTPAEAAQALADAKGGGHSVVPWGSGTAQAMGGLPDSYHLVCATSGMSAILEYEPADLVVSVGAGTTISKLQSTLHSFGQFFAIDGVEANATIGGIVATNRSGPSRLLYGSARDLVLGITAALPNGDVVKSGGRVVKNVVGYDLNKLHIGAFGTLGLICEVTVKVHPLPRAEASVVGQFRSLDAANGVAHALARSNLSLRAVDVTTDHSNPPAAFTTSVTVWCSGWPAAVERQLREVTVAFTQASAVAVDELHGQDHVNLRAQLEALRVRPARIKFSVVPDKLHRLQVEVMQALRADGVADATWVARAGIGVAHLGLRDLDRPALTKLRGIAESHGGTCVTETASAELQTSEHAWGRVRDDYRIMKRIRDEFDPSRTINPGRFVGGL